jgi:hypothetical protein
VAPEVGIGGIILWLRATYTHLISTTQAIFLSAFGLRFHYLVLTVLLTVNPARRYRVDSPRSPQK